jgi:FlaA1/EpsC-like NDP-sugar epimerase
VVVKYIVARLYLFPDCSLQATWIRNSILHALQKTTELNTRAIESTFVYQNPSILALTRFILNFTSELSSSTSVKTGKVEEMLNLVTKYGKDFVVHQGSATPLMDVVLVTGTTGAIGSAVLAELAKSQNVARIFAFNRKGMITLTERQKNAFKDRGIDPILAESPKVVLVEADLARPGFGVNDELMEEVCSSFLFVFASDL